MITKAHLKVIQNFHQELWVFCAKVNGKIDLQAGDVIGNAKRINAYRAETRNFRAALQNKRARTRCCGPVFKSIGQPPKRCAQPYRR